MMKSEIPRRARLDQNTPAELAIRHAMEKVEELPAHPLLTEAVNLLSQAKEKVADYEDLEVGVYRVQVDVHSPTKNLPQEGQKVIFQDKEDQWHAGYFQTDTTDGWFRRSNGHSTSKRKVRFWFPQIDIEQWSKIGSEEG